MGPKFSGPKALSVLGSKPRFALYYQNVAMSTHFPFIGVSTGGRSKGKQVSVYRYPCKSNPNGCFVY